VGGSGGLSALQDQILTGQGGAAAQQADNSELEASCQTGADAVEQDDCFLVGVVNSVQEYWTEVFAEAGISYTPTRTRFFSDAVSTGCGNASAKSGPFYCPADRFIYIDLTFFEDFRNNFGATAGRFAQAYVIAHEYGHHVQNLLGDLNKAQDRSGPQSGAVRVELQADCYAGAWAANAEGRGIIEEFSEADIADGLDAAAKVGDDYIQERFQGTVNPESWTHGSSAQRQSWFRRGLDTGDPSRCDAFTGSI
jgi:uncharacterized protein